MKILKNSTYDEMQKKIKDQRGEINTLTKDLRKVKYDIRKLTWEVNNPPKFEIVDSIDGRAVVKVEVYHNPLKSRVWDVGVLMLKAIFGGTKLHENIFKGEFERRYKVSGKNFCTDTSDYAWLTETQMEELANAKKEAV